MKILIVLVFNFRTAVVTEIVTAAVLQFSLSKLYQPIHDFQIQSITSDLSVDLSASRPLVCSFEIHVLHRGN